MKRYLCSALFIFFFLDGQAQLLSDTLQLRAFMDGLMQTHLRDKHIAGATVSVVQDGKVLLTKGYGFSDLCRQTPVKGDSTLFRIGSISKLFTWISVMQLVSQGKLKLDEDVNHYLKDFQIPATFPQPITLKHLMTHTAGFDDKVIGLFGNSPSSLKPLSEILKAELPDRLRTPGTSASYSNHGSAIAAYLVEQASGMSFNDYVEKNILQPLHMTHTTFRQPLPPSLKPMMSKGYGWEGGELREKEFEFVPLYPIGGAASTSADMTRFMIAILNGGKLDQFKLLDSATLELMESPAHRHHPSVNPMRYGFMDASYNGITIIGHGGATLWFHSFMALYPEFHTGIFFSFNTDQGGPLHADVIQEFTDRFFPRRALRKAIRVDDRFFERFEGAYRSNRYAHQDLTAVVSLFEDLHIDRADSGRLKLSRGEMVKYYVPVDSTTFREEHSSRVIAFKENADHEITQLFLGDLPIMAFDHVKGLGHAGLHGMIFGMIVMLTVMMLFYWPVTTRARRGFEPMGSTLLIPAGAKVVAWVNYFLLAVFYVGLAMLISGPEAILYGVATSVKILLTIPLIVCFTTVLMWMNLYRIFGNYRYRVWSRVFYLVLSLMSLAALWQLYYVNLLGYWY